MSDLNNLNKGQLRQAMRDAGLSYAGLNNDGMREALEAHAEANRPNTDGTGMQESDVPLNLDDDAANIGAGAAFGGFDPHAASNARIAHMLHTPESEYVQAGANCTVVPVPEFAPLPATVVEALPIARAEVSALEDRKVDLNHPEAMGMPVAGVVTRNTSKGVKIEKDRPVQNGVKMPSAGSLCRAVWDELERAVVAGTPYDAKGIKAHAATVGWNANNASIEYYNWRKFKGISGRSK